MNNLLSDFLNDRLAPVCMGGVVNGVMDYRDEEDLDKHYSSGSESDAEQQEYVNRELATYFPESQTEEPRGLTDIVDGLKETNICEMLDVPIVFNKFKFDLYFKRELPIDSYREKILDMINTNSVVIIHGHTGCGKTTQVPQYILDQCKETKSPCNIVVTQPRRIAAINISQRVCEERGWVMGTVCGYQVGLDKSAGEDVVLTYVTTEVLLQKLILQKNLNRYTHIIIDEVHERNKTLDFLLLIVRKYLFTNSLSVKVILMSATMQAEEFAHYFRRISRANPGHYIPPPILHVDKMSEYTTNIYYNDQFSNTQLIYNIDEPCITQEQYELCWKLILIFDSLDKESFCISGETTVGSVLVFLPGFHEIQEMDKILQEKGKRSRNVAWDIIPLHSTLTSDQMSKAFQKPKPGVRKIILSTNIAESSVTVPDVSYVIDFCLTKIMTVNKVTKFSTLCLQWAARNNCTQRAGRVGRIANGRVYRLVPQDFYSNQMQSDTTPELQRAPLENIVLYMKLLNLNDTPKSVLSLAISPPNLKDVESCVWHLKEVGALLQTYRGNPSSADGDLTFLGRVMGALPIDIHFSKMIVLGHMFSCLQETVTMAAGCMTKNIFVSNFRDRFKCYRKKLVWSDSSQSDFMIYLNLYNVWLKRRRENAFRSPNEEYAWCKTNFVNLKGLREWDILIKEIHQRLKRLGIEKSLRVDQKVHLSPVEKPTVLKVIICGAFYPNYFVRSCEYGQIDSKEAVRTLNGRDPKATVYFTNMKHNHPGHIYVRQIKKLLNAENDFNVQIGFDAQSTKVYVEYKNVQQPEAVTVEERKYIQQIPGGIAIDVYEAVRKRQLKVPFRLQLLPDDKAWEFANNTGSRLTSQNSITTDENVDCYTGVDYCPLPPLDITIMTVIVTHVEDVGHFYCQNWNDETRMLLDRIFDALNGPGILLDPIAPDYKVKARSEYYAARYNVDGKFYRCQILSLLTKHKTTYAQVQFVDYGNVQRVAANLLYTLPKSTVCQIAPIAMCCALSEVQPCLVLNPKALWSERANNIFRKKTEKLLLEAYVYSVVYDTVHLELYLCIMNNKISFNQWLINEGYGQKCEESFLSRMDHEKRLQVSRADAPSNMSRLHQSSKLESYADFEEPDIKDVSEIIELRGPHSPLEMKIFGLIRASLSSTVQVAGESVNAVLLDENPEDPHTRLLVAGQVSQSASSRRIQISQTTLMPSIPGYPAFMTMLFCPKMEPKPTSDGFSIASILCGLGFRESGDKPNFPEHDILLVLDTEINTNVISKVNELRYNMNRAMKTMNNIYDEMGNPKDLFECQKELKRLIFDLIHTKQNGMDQTHVKYEDVWGKKLCDLPDVKIYMQDEDDDIWPLHWWVHLNEDKERRGLINKNLDELLQIARKLVPEKEIACLLCNSILYTCSDVRVHIYSQEHKDKLAKYRPT